MNTIKPGHIKKFQKLTKQLNKLMEEIVAYNPEAELYVEDSWNFNLMKGPTHDENSLKSLQENVVVCETVFRSSGGGW